MAPPGRGQPEAPARYFTLAEANDLLPEVRRLLADLRGALGQLEELRGRLPRKDDEIVRPEPDSPVDPGHFRGVLLFHAALQRFQELGIQVKDVARGLVDFPARAGHDDVLLCWQEGEDAIRFFHDAESGFAGRRPIEELASLLPPPRAVPEDEE